MYSFAFNLAGEMDIGYAANNMIICSVTQSVQRIFDKKSLHHLVFALRVFYISNFTKPSSITEDLCS